MELEKEECIHVAEVLEQTKSALNTHDALKLKDLSDNTIHSACSYQDSGSITIAVLLYSLSKLIARDDHKKIRSWPKFIKKFNSILDLAILALKQDKQDKYRKYIELARKTLESQSVSIRQYIKEVLKKASINKGSKIHAHGISLEQTSKLLGISQWELSDYIGQRADDKHAKTINTRTRAKMAMEFFS